MPTVLLFFQETWGVSCDAAPFLLLGFAVAAAMHRYIRPEWMIRVLGKGRWKPPVMAALLGVPLPLCSCSVVPTALAIQKKGAPKGATLSFFIATPETGVDSIILSYGLLGPVVAVARPLAAALSAISAGWLVEWISPNQPSHEDAGTTSGGEAHSHNPQIQQTASCCSKPVPISLPATPAGEICCPHPEVRPSTQAETPHPAHCESQEKNPREKPDDADQAKSCCGAKATASAGPSVMAREWQGLKHSFFMLFDEVAFWIGLGLVLSGLVAAFLPKEVFESSWTTGWRGMSLAVLIGLPMYVCATASTPLAAVMVAKGFSVGSAVVFLLVGPATNLGTLLIVTKMLGKAAVLSYLVSIVAVSLLFGWSLDTWFPEAGATWMQAAHEHSSGASFAAPVAAALLWALLVWRGGFPRLRRG